MLHRHLNNYSIFFPFAINDLIIQRCLAFVQISDKLFDSTLVMECMLSDFFFTKILQNNLQAFCKKCHLTQSLL